MYVACSPSPYTLASRERVREKNATHYNRAGSKMLRLMEINGFVRYVLICEALYLDRSFIVHARAHVCVCIFLFAYVKIIVDSVFH